MRLLGPLLLLLLVAAAGWGLVSDLSTRRQIEVLVDQQGSAVLQGIDLRLRELRQAQEVNARLLVDEAGLPADVQRRDLVEVSQTLASVQAKLGVERVTVYTADAQELLNMGPRQVGLAVDPLVAAALAGHTDSTTAVTGEGLAVLAATPILDYGRVVGALLVGSTLDGDALKEISDRQGVELAVLRDGRLVGATTDDPDLARALRAFATTTSNRTELEEALGLLLYRPAFLPLPDDGLVVAMVSTHPLVEASDQRNLILAVGTIGLIVAVLAVGLALARDIARPLENLVGVTRDLVAGDYRRRVARSSIRELGELGDAVNHLAGELQRRVAELTHQAVHDALTGLPNRTVLHGRTEQAILTAHGERLPFALLLLDLDRFKEVNDTLGHQAGDHLLREVARRLQTTLRTSDTVARLGGDEFAVLLPGTDQERAVAVAQQLLLTLEAPFDLDGQPIEIGASIGVTGYPIHGSDAATLLRKADVAMYVAKRGESGIVVDTAEQDHHGTERLALGGELRSAIELGQLLLHFQPKLDLREGTLVGVEALVRWQHPLRGFLPPSEFIPLAEETGLIYPLTRWVLGAALEQHQAWRDMGLDIPVAVNLSRRTLHDPLLPELVGQLLARYAAPPSALVLEITESSLMADPQRVGENLTQLRALGVRMSIDDFGTGYSSLASLKTLSVDELKIDQSFVQAMATDASARAIVRAIIDLADALQLRVVAEGVEDRATWDVLAELGCDVAQGYFLSRPIGAAEVEAWIAHGSQSRLDCAGAPHVEVALQERIRGRGARLTAEEEFVARKQAEAALGTSEERNRLALQAAGMGTWDWDPISDVHTWSVETEALYGLAAGTYDGTFAGFRRSVHPDDWPALEQELEASLAEHRDSIVTYRAIWPDGSLHWLEEKGRRLFAADGTLVRMTGTSMDITERKRAEEALQASAERFRKQYKGIPLPTYSWVQAGDDFVLQDYNDAAETINDGVVRAGIGMRASERFADRPDMLADIQVCAAEQRTFRRETYHRYPGTEHARQLAYTFVFVPPLTVMIHREDITDAKRAQRQREGLSKPYQLPDLLRVIATPDTAA